MTGGHTRWWCGEGVWNGFDTWQVVFTLPGMPVKTSKKDRNKAIVRDFQESLWRGDFSVLDKYVPQGIWLTPEGREQLKEGKRAAMRAMPDLTFTIDELIGEGDTVILRWTIAGTHSTDTPTPFGLAKASGKHVAHRGFSLHHLKDGMIIDDLFGSNIMDYWAQLGVLPKSGG